MSSDGKTIAIGAPYNTGNGSDAGHARVYQNMSGAWTKIGKDIDGKGAGDLTGYSVSLSADGKTLLVGSPGNTENTNDNCYVRVFNKISISKNN